IPAASAHRAIFWRPQHGLPIRLREKQRGNMSPRLQALVKRRLVVLCAATVACTSIFLGGAVFAYPGLFQDDDSSAVQSGPSDFYSTTDKGAHWYDGITPFPSLPTGDNLDGGGDPAIVFDRSGVVYYAQINFNRTDDTSGVWVNRSTNGGFTWTRPCVAIGTTDASAVCGGRGDARQPGDGTVG